MPPPEDGPLRVEVRRMCSNRPDPEPGRIAGCATAEEPAVPAPTCRSRVLGSRRGCGPVIGTAHRTGLAGLQHWNAWDGSCLIGLYRGRFPPRDAGACRQPAVADAPARGLVGAIQTGPAQRSGGVWPGSCLTASEIVECDPVGGEEPCTASILGSQQHSAFALVEQERIDARGARPEAASCVMSSSLRRRRGRRGRPGQSSRDARLVGRRGSPGRPAPGRSACSRERARVGGKCDAAVSSVGGAGARTRAPNDGRPAATVAPDRQVCAHSERIVAVSRARASRTRARRHFPELNASEAE